MVRLGLILQSVVRARGVGTQNYQTTVLDRKAYHVQKRKGRSKATHEYNDIKLPTK